MGDEGDGLMILWNRTVSSSLSSPSCLRLNSPTKVCYNYYHIDAAADSDGGFDLQATPAARFELPTHEQKSSSELHTRKKF